MRQLESNTIEHRIREVRIIVTSIFKKKNIHNSNTTQEKLPSPQFYND